jgi:hypothetical protein
MSDDQRPGGRAGQQDEPADEVEGHGNKAGYNKPGLTEETEKDNDEVEAHHHRAGDKAADKTA